jgi:hypothetical protein
MVVPFTHLDVSLVPKHSSIGDIFISNLFINGLGLVDCLSSRTTFAIHSSDSSRPPLSHADSHSFISNFSSSSSSQLFWYTINDRIVILLIPFGPEYAVAMLALSTLPFQVKVGLTLEMQMGNCCTSIRKSYSSG